MKNVIFVCYGNICRSPMAQGIFKKIVQDAGLKDFVIESAGFHPQMIDKPYHPLAIATCAQHEIKLEGVSRLFQKSDLEKFDWVLAMDRSALLDLQDLDREKKFHKKMKLIREFSGPADNVPDPINGEKEEFHFVYSLLDEACRGFLQTIKSI